MAPEEVAPLSAKNDRLIQLVIKGILYESCVSYCQQKATTTGKQPKINSLHELKISKHEKLALVKCFDIEIFYYLV